MKILVGLATCRKRTYAAGDHVGHQDSPNNPRIDSVLDTWYSDWAERYTDKFDVRFFVGNGIEKVNLPDLVELNVLDDYTSLPAKVQAMFKWALDAGYDYVAKVDDDVLLHSANFLKFFQQVDYCGYELEAAIGKYASGAAYVVSRKAMQLVVDATWVSTPWIENFNSAEDQIVGEVLKRNGIHLLHDHRYLCCHCDSCFKKFGLDNLITIHTRSPQQMYELHRKLAC